MKVPNSCVAIAQPAPQILDHARCILQIEQENFNRAQGILRRLQDKLDLNAALEEDKNETLDNLSTILHKIENIEKITADVLESSLNKLGS